MNSLYKRALLLLTSNGHRLRMNLLYQSALIFLVFQRSLYMLVATNADVTDQNCSSK